jgi:hypothetical protein
VFRTTVMFGLLAYSFIAFGQIHTDPARLYADSMARAIVANDEQKLYDNFAPIMRNTYSRAELLNPLKRSREIFGDISRYEYRNATVGGELVGGRTIRTATCWYAATTTKFSTGPFLKVAVTYDHGRFYLAGYSVERFIGDHIPSGLQGSKK